MSFDLAKTSLLDQCQASGAFLAGTNKCAARLSGSQVSFARYSPQPMAAMAAGR